MVYLEEALFFLEGLEEKARDKILYNISKCRFSVDPELFKKLNGNIWEFRTLYNRLHFRLFAFWYRTGSSGTLVVATHGRIKKSSKVLRSDLEKAMIIRVKYIEEI